MRIITADDAMKLRMTDAAFVPYEHFISQYSAARRLSW